MRTKAAGPVARRAWQPTRGMLDYTSKWVAEAKGVCRH